MTLTSDGLGEDGAALEEVRQTLMTHMWPGMVRKDSLRSGGTFESDEEVGLDSDEEDAGPEAIFPVTFASTSAHRTQAGPASEFPNMEELRKHLHDEQEEPDWDKRVGPGEEEYARLDEWLDEDDDEFPAQSTLPMEEAEPEAERSRNGMLEAEQDQNIGAQIGDGFQDDFDDFAPFQAGPSRRRKPGDGGDLVSMDPTPLLMHLQDVRAELAEVEDEVERRKRAGREVERAMKELGMSVDEFELDEDEDMSADLMEVHDGDR